MGVAKGHLANAHLGYLLPPHYHYYHDVHATKYASLGLESTSKVSEHVDLAYEHNDKAMKHLQKITTKPQDKDPETSTQTGPRSGSTNPTKPQDKDKDPETTTRTGPCSGCRPTTGTEKTDKTEDETNTETDERKDT